MTTCYKRTPEHVGIIPDGNRRWALNKGLRKEDGYEHGVEPAMRMFHDIWDQGVKEVSVYVFTKENVHRPKDQVHSFKKAFLRYLEWAEAMDASILVVGDATSRVFPPEALDYTAAAPDREHKNRLNFLVNYNWEWDLAQAFTNGGGNLRPRSIAERIGSHHIPRLDLVVRWGGRNRFSGFLPLQSAYADLYVIGDFWPNYTADHLHEALQWYDCQDVTMGG